MKASDAATFISYLSVITQSPAETAKPHCVVVFTSFPALAATKLYCMTTEEMCEKLAFGFHVMVIWTLAIASLT